MTKPFLIGILFAITVISSPTQAQTAIPKINADVLTDVEQKTKETGLRWLNLSAPGREKNMAAKNDLLKVVRQYALDHEDVELYVIALRSLAQMKAAEVLPYLKTDGTLGERTVRARILAERQARGTRDARRRANLFLDVFLKEMGIKEADLSKRVIESFGFRDIPEPDGRFSRADRHRILNEIADHIYQERETAITTEAKRRGIDFDAWEPAYLKVELAPFSREERVLRLVEKISKIKAIDLAAAHTIQLAANEGSLGSDAAANKLTQMIEESKLYPEYGFVSLLEVLRIAGDRSKIPFLEEYLRNPEVAKYKDIPGYGFHALKYLTKGIIQPLAYGY